MRLIKWLFWALVELVIFFILYAIIGLTFTVILFLLFGLIQGIVGASKNKQSGDKGRRLP